MRNFFATPAVYLSSASSDERGSIETNGNWHSIQIEVLDDMPPFRIPLIDGVVVRWDVKVYNNNRLPVVIKFVSGYDVWDKLTEHVAQMQRRIRVKKAKLAEGADNSQDFVLIENDLEKVMRDLQADADARPKELEAHEDMLKSLCDLFLEDNPGIDSATQKQFHRETKKKPKFGIGSGFVQTNAIAQAVGRRGQIHSL